MLDTKPQNEDPNLLLKLEKAIQQKYGNKAIVNPKATWDQDKELEYLKQIKELSRKEEKYKENSNDVIDINGVSISKQLFNKKDDKVCIICNVYSFKRYDDIYLSKYRCCFKCYEARVEKDINGWLNKIRNENS